MNISIHEYSIPKVEIHLSHELSDREMVKLRKEVEPFDYIQSIPSHGSASRPHGTIM